jgi:DNA-binding NtrC family response regulator
VTGFKIPATLSRVYTGVILNNFLNIDDKDKERIYLEVRNMNSLSTDPKITSKETILVVDDEAGPRESLRMILKPRYEVHTACDGQEALRLIKNKDINVVTLDLNMPGLSGIEVLKEIRKLKPDTEVIIITGYGTLTNAQEAMRFGAGDFISKPFKLADITSIVANSFERRRYNLKIKSLLIRAINSSHLSEIML